MKKQGKAYLGMLLSVIMALSIPFSTVTAAEEDTNVATYEETVTELDDENNGGAQDPDEMENPDGEEEPDNAEEGQDPDGSDGSGQDGEPNTISVDSITLNKSSVTLKVKGQTAELTATISPEDATEQAVIWASSDTSVATVKDGTVTAAGKNGSATITATSVDNPDASADCTVTVSLYSDGFHQEPDGSDWYYYKNGAVNTSKTDVIKGTVNGKSGWWNVVKGKVTKGETVAKNSNGWWYINSNGMVDFSYTGFAKNSNGWWYLEDGKVNFNKNSVIKDTKKKIDGKQSWWYVVGSKVQTDFTGLADYRNSNGWWYVNDGKVTFDVETVAKNKNGWYYVKDSKVDFSYNGFAKNSNGWWYLEDGKVNFNKNSVIKDTKKKIDGKQSWWYVVGSKVQTNFTGLADYRNSNGWWYISQGKVTFDVDTVAKNKNGWWYVKNSEVIFSYNGFAKNENGWWYINNGKVDFGKNSVIKGKVNGTNAWWYVVGGKVKTSFTGLADYSNENGWWYINDGKVTFNVNTVAKNKNGWYYVKDSKVDFSYSGAAQNENGWWYIRDGKVDFSTGTVVKVGSDWLYYYNGKYDSSYTGIAPNENGTWYVKNGKVDFSYSGTVTVNGAQYIVTDGKVGVAVSSTMNSKAQSKSSSTKWLIVVDTSACKLGVFSGSKGNWVAQKYWNCSPGKPSTPTKKGTFTVGSKGKSFSGSDYTCWYYTQFYGNYLIHSVLYKRGSMSSFTDGRLGMQLSHGCVRLALENAKWVYDNIPKGSTVYVY